MRELLDGEAAQAVAQRQYRTGKLLLRGGKPGAILNAALDVHGVLPISHGTLISDKDIKIYQVGLLLHLKVSVVSAGPLVFAVCW